MGMIKSIRLLSVYLMPIRIKSQCGASILGDRNESHEDAEPYVGAVLQLNAIWLRNLRDKNIFQLVEGAGAEWTFTLPVKSDNLRIFRR